MPFAQTSLFLFSINSSVFPEILSIGSWLLPEMPGNGNTRCALAAKEAGLDGVELHGAHAHEIAQFLSPYYNHRTDEYGVDYLGRSKLYRDIVSSIKQACGREFPVICRISSSERIPGRQGRGIEETVKIAPLLEAAGADAIHVSIGMPLSEIKDKVLLPQK